MEEFERYKQCEDILQHIPEIINNLKVCGYYLVRNCALDRLGFTKLVSHFGHVVGYSRDRSDDLITEIGNDSQDVICGTGQLPLHFDGGLTDYRVDHVFLYAHKVKGIISGGETVICDMRRAVATMPSGLREILDTHQLGLWICREDTPKEKNEWKNLPFYSDFNGEKRLNLYMPFDAGQPKSWKVRVQGMSNIESKRFFKAIKAHLSQHVFNYYHHWHQDDLLIFDNRRVLHAREPFSQASGSRVLWRGLSRE